MNWKVLARSLAVILSVALLCGAVLMVYFFIRTVYEPSQSGLPEASARAQAERERIDLGAIEFEKFHALATQEDWQGARLLCERILREYPESARAADAARVLTEMNLDALLSRDPYEGKQVYTVKSGDSIGRVAQRFDCSQAYIISVSRLKRAPNIQPNDQLIVCPLHFRLEVDLNADLLRVFELYRKPDGTQVKPEENPQNSEQNSPIPERFFAVFPLLQTRFAQNQAPRGSDKIRGVLGLGEKGPIPSYDARFPSAEKVIRLENGLSLRSLPEAAEGQEQPSQVGIYLQRHDLEDLSRILRPGQEVKFIQAATTNNGSNA